MFEWYTSIPVNPAAYVDKCNCKCSCGGKLKQCLQITYVGQGKSVQCPAKIEFGNFCREHSYGENVYLPKPREGQIVPKGG